MNVISLFAGIGGFDRAFTKVGARVVAHVELDPDARAVLNLHFPDALSFSDVRSVGRHNLPACDILCGGFPCQDLSVAGNRAGLAGARSGLFYEMVRITDELRPAFLLWENVPGLLSSDGGRDFARILRALDNIGYSGAWTGLDAQFFGLAQRRQRIFGLWARDDIGAEPCAKILALAARLPWNTQARPEARTDVAATIRGSSSNHGVNRPGRRGDDDVNILPFDTTQITSPVDRCNPKYGSPCHPLAAGAHPPAIVVADTLTANYGKQIDSRDSNLGPPNLLMVAATLNSGGAGGGFRTEPGEHIVPFISGVRRLTPLECERLQGFPDDWTKYRKSDGTLRNMREFIAWATDDSGIRRTIQSDSARYRQLGNAVAVPVVEWIASRLVSWSRRSREAESARRAKASGAYGEWQMCCLDDFIRGVERG